MSGLLEGTPLASIPGAVAAGLVAGTLLPLLGVWVVVQRVVFLGVTLAQVAAAGVALGFLLDAPALAVGMVATLVVAAAVVRRSGAGGPPTAGDGTLGALFCGASALALLFVAHSPAELDEVNHLLHGNLIYASGQEVGLTAAALLLGVAVVGAFRSRILFAVYDAETATALGIDARRWLLLLFGVLAVVLTVCMRTTGSLLSFAMLVLPALGALALGRGLGTTFAAAAGLGLVGTLAGLFLAVSADVHVESSIVVCLAVALPACGAWRRHPLAGVGVVAVALAAALSLVAARPDEAASTEHPHHHGAPVIEAEDQPWHADVVLNAGPATDGLSVGWTVDVWRRDEASELPHELWVVITGEGVFHEHELLHDLPLLPTGHSRHTGSCLVPAPPGTHRVEGQLWTGSPLSADAEPVEPFQGDVTGADVSR
jgi:zinc transport system permease protein